VKQHLLKHLAELTHLTAEDRLKSRYAKFRAHGHFIEKELTPGEKEEAASAAAAVA